MRKLRIKWTETKTTTQTSSTEVEVSDEVWASIQRDPTSFKLGMAYAPKPEDATIDNSSTETTNTLDFDDLGEL